MAIIASMVVTLTVIPALCLMFLPGVAIDRRESPLVAWLKRMYEPALARTIKGGGTAIAAVAVITIIGIAIVPML